jgi:2-keto-4-pentenoate hydratase
MTFDHLTGQLASARAATRMLDPAPWLDLIANVDDAYAVQSLLAKRPGSDVRGWKVTALSADQQRLYAANRPVAGALLAPFVHAGPATLPLKSYLAPLLECEVSFLLGADLPARPQPYSREEIEASVEAIVPAMEIVDGRWPDDAPGLLKLADSMSNGAFITGKPVANWRSLDLSRIDVSLSHDGDVIERGSSSRILGNPLLAVVALANAQPLPCGGLKRGHIVTTGTCTTPVVLKAGRYVGEFGVLGTLTLDMAG